MVVVGTVEVGMVPDRAPEGALARTDREVRGITGIRVTVRLNTEAVVWVIRFRRDECPPIVG